MTKLLRAAIMGAPASGKGTISEKIIEKFDVVHVSLGDIFRQNIVDNTPLGNSVQKYMKEGKLVPDVLVMKIMLEKLGELKNNNWLCDGFPRTMVQAEKLFMKYPLNLVINLKVPFEVIINRAQNRWVHVPSGRVYNTSFKPPKVPGKDDVTGEPLTQRPDDNPEVVALRLKVYAEQSEPLIRYFRKHGVLKEFEGSTTDDMWPLIDEELLKHIPAKT